MIKRSINVEDNNNISTNLAVSAELVMSMKLRSQVCEVNTNVFINFTGHKEQHTLFGALFPLVRATI